MDMPIRLKNKFLQSFVLLAFKRPSIERIFLREHVNRSILQTRLALVLGLAMYALFGLLDLWIYPAASSISIPTRFIIVPLVFAGSFLATFLFRRWFELIAIVALSAAHAGHMALILTGVFPPAYAYSITIIILTFLFAFSRIRFMYAIPVALAVIVSFHVVILGKLSYTLQMLSETDFFIISFLVLGISAGYSIERFLRADFVKTRLLNTERNKSERLLQNILPAAVCHELKERGVTRPIRYDNASVMFADFVGFTKATEGVPAGTLIATLDQYFSQFDVLITKYGLEKIKTIGDEYMAVAGIPESSTTHALDCIMAALDFLEYGQLYRNEDNDLLKLDMRIGISSGPLVAGVLGKRKFTYDVFGNTVNNASRVQGASRPGRVTVSRSTWDLVQDFFDAEDRGVVKVKNGEELELFSIQRFKEQYSLDSDGTMPNLAFAKQYDLIKSR